MSERLWIERWNFLLRKKAFRRPSIFCQYHQTQKRQMKAAGDRQKGGGIRMRHASSLRRGQRRQTD
jgi:hypothetical protein